MSKIAIPHDAMIFVGDGRKALFLRNEGDETSPNLKTERVFADDNPPTHEQGTDKPGSTFAGANTTRRASVGQTDWHHLEEHRFVERVAARRWSMWCAIAQCPRSSSPHRRAHSPTCAARSMTM